MMPHFLRPSSHFIRYSVRPLTLSLAAVLTCAGIAPAALRPGAPRALRLEWKHDAPAAMTLQAAHTVGDAAQPVFSIDPRRDNSSKPPAIFFMAEVDGTRNIWQSTTDSGSFDADNFKAGQWQAQPITRLAAPSWASEPTPTHNGRALLYTSNANLSKPGVVQPTSFSQIMHLDLQSNLITALTEGLSHNHSPAVAPDDSRFAFISDRGGLETLYMMPIRGGLARRVATLAQNPCWLDESTLLYRSTRAGQEGLYRVKIGPDGAAGRSSLLLRNGLEATISPDGRLICAVIQNGSGTNAKTQLCTLAPDGSGVQTLTGTDGARSPHFSANGNAVVFDAPAGNDSKQRTLWLLPMQRSLPIAQLRAVRPARNERMNSSLGGAVATEVEIIGTAFAEAVGTVNIKVEVGEGSEPGRWVQLTSRPAPIHGATLATWQPPLNARCDWTVRLTVTDATGDSAQSTLGVSLPIEPQAAAPLTPFVFSNDAIIRNPSQAVTPSAPAPAPTATPRPQPTAIPTPTRAPVAVPRQTSPRRNNSSSSRTRPAPRRSGNSQPVRPGSTVPILPLPALPPAPDQTAPDASTSGQQAVTELPEFPVMTAPEATNPADSPAPPQQPNQTQPSRPPGTQEPRASSTSRSRPSASSTRTTSRPTLRPAASGSVSTNSNSSDRAQLRIEGTPAEMAVGERVEVRATLKNTGSTGWASSGDRPVRLIYRWVDLKSGYRRRWAFQWLRASVAPGDSTQLRVSLAAPPYPGHYRLIYALIRIDADGYTPPAATKTSEQANWPGEFGGTAFIVDVR